MKVIIALEEMIKDNENVIKSIKKQLSNHESGESKLTFMGKASAETNLENAQEQLERHKAKLKELLTHDMSELEERERVREAIERKNYINYQKVRIKREVSKSNDEKLEAMLILDELKEDCHIEDRELFEIVSKVISLDLTVHCELENTLNEIKSSSKLARRLGLKVAAGHGLNYQNVNYMTSIKEIQELNIGQSIIARSVFTGLERAIVEMKELVSQ